MSEQKPLLIVGRALFLCQRFEKSLHFYSGFAELMLCDFDAEQAAERLLKLQMNGRIDRIQKFLSTGHDGDIKAEVKNFSLIFKAAREGRNFIAHDSLAIIDHAEDVLDEIDWAKRIRPRTRLIEGHIRAVVIAADYLNWIDHNINEGPYTPPIAVSYVDRMVEWVMTGQGRPGRFPTDEQNLMFGIRPST